MSKVFFIAEAGVNHNGSRARAIDLVRAAAAAGADAVKFQTFKAEAVAASSARKAAYQTQNTGSSESQLEMLKALELSDADFIAVAQACQDSGIEFMSTPFDFESLEALVAVHKVRRLKCPSGEITNGPFLLAMARAQLPIILSTGIATIDEIAEALAVLAFGYLTQRQPEDFGDIQRVAASPEAQAALLRNVTILHCTSAYPAPVADLNLRAMDLIRERFNLPVGYSDHSQGLHVSVAAVALGAVCIEKHFTMDRTLPGPDHKASLEPDELKTLIAQVRETTLALGIREKKPTAAEEDTKAVARRSLVAKTGVAAGDRLPLDRLGALRPGGGLSPMRAWDVAGVRANRAYAAGEALDAEILTSLSDRRRG